MKSSGLGIADVVVATAALQPNVAGREAIVRMCGMELTPRQSGTGPLQKPPIDAAEDDQTTVTGQAAGQAQTQTLPPSVRRLEPVRTVTRPAPPKDPLVPSYGTPAPTAPPTFEGLLTLRDGIELLRMAASVFVSADKLDVARITRQLAYAQPLTDLPRLRVPSLALGAQILVDVGQSMQPFYEDQQDLVQRLGRNLRDLAEIRYFADDPARGCGPQRRRSTWHEYAMPLPQVPVIVLTDLGCGYPRRPDALHAWLRLADQLRRRQSRLVVFAAVRLNRVPDELRRSADLVLWDRSAIRRNVMQLAGADNE
jgi:hypothetical protein